MERKKRVHISARTSIPNTVEHDSTPPMGYKAEWPNQGNVLRFPINYLANQIHYNIN